MTATLVYTISLALVFFLKKSNTLFKKKAKARGRNKLTFSMRVFWLPARQQNPRIATLRKGFANAASSQKTPSKVVSYFRRVPKPTIAKRVSKNVPTARPSYQERRMDMEVV